MQAGIIGPDCSARAEIFRKCLGNARIFVRINAAQTAHLLFQPSLFDETRHGQLLHGARCLIIML